MEQLVQRPAGETGRLSDLPDEKGHESKSALVERRDAVNQPRRATGDLSLDDLEAAQALEGLRADCAHQTRLHHQNHSTASKAQSSPPSEEPSEPEPLLALFTAQHPLLSTAINGPLSAYSTSKSFSPRFKYGAELVERHVGSPVVNTVRTAGRYTGLETSVRWFLDGERREGPSRASKRRRTNYPTGAASDDVEQGLQDETSLAPLDRRDSTSGTCHEDLPPYDDERSPTYEQHDSSVQPDNGTHSSTNTTWRTRLVMSTSGLGVAMSEESLRNLRYCLSWLRWGNDYLYRAIRDLQGIIKEYDATDEEASKSEANEVHGERQPSERSRDKSSISGRMHSLKSDILETMSQLCHVVSQYTGGALPSNARSLVHAHLTALPGRFTYVLRLKRQQSASPGTKQESAKDTEAGSPTPEPVVDSAHRVLILASEGLDMIAQITSIVNGTITSAEEWCNRLGRNPRSETNSPEQQPKQQQQDDKKDLEQSGHSESKFEKDEPKDMKTS
ncbi:MAG: hypothetical protein Q9172_004076 [Xanthocarpia lactea]